MKPIQPTCIQKHAQRGITLIEALLALLILCLGVLGLAVVQARMVMETRTTDSRATANPSLSIFGRDGTAAPGTPATPDTLAVSYAAANDGTPALNGVGNEPLGAGNVAYAIVSAFSVKNNNLVCGNGTNASASQPIASNVMNMRVRYLTVGAAGGVTSRTATEVTNADQWNQINGAQVCLDMQGDQMQRDFSQTYTHCEQCRHNRCCQPGGGAPLAQAPSIPCMPCMTASRWRWVR